jgi:hypothetical protein
MPANAPARHAIGLPEWLTVVFAIASGMMVANIYYTRSLVRLIAPALGLRESLAGLIVTLTGMAMALLTGGYFLTEQPAALAAGRAANSL